MKVNREQRRRSLPHGVLAVEFNVFLTYFKDEEDDGDYIEEDEEDEEEEEDGGLCR